MFCGLSLPEPDDLSPSRAARATAKRAHERHHGGITTGQRIRHRTFAIHFEKRCRVIAEHGNYPVDNFVIMATSWKTNCLGVVLDIIERREWITELCARRQSAPWRRMVSNERRFFIGKDGTELL